MFLLCFNISLNGGSPYHWCLFLSHFLLYPNTPNSPIYLAPSPLHSHCWVSTSSSRGLLSSLLLGLQTHPSPFTLLTASGKQRREQRERGTWKELRCVMCIGQLHMVNITIKYCKEVLTNISVKWIKENGGLVMHILRSLSVTPIIFWIKPLLPSQVYNLLISPEHTRPLLHIQYHHFHFRLWNVSCPWWVRPGSPLFLSHRPNIFPSSSTQ